ncbi:MAG TPA: hypothetical protein VIQ30_16040 [Pseudonocardia sp.]|jgi:hypothetical protein
MRPRPVLLAATIAIPVIYLAGVAILGTPPDATASGQQVADWFGAHRHEARAYAWLLTILMPTVAVYAALVRERLPGPHRDVLLIGSVTFSAANAIAAWLWATLAWHTSDPVVERALLDLASFWGPVLTGSTLTMIAPVVALWRRTDVALPRWLSALGLVALVEQFAETVTIFGDTGFTAPGGPMNLYLGAGLTLAWTTALGIVLSRRPPLVVTAGAVA